MCYIYSILLIHAGRIRIHEFLGIRITNKICMHYRKTLSVNNEPNKFSINFSFKIQFDCEHCALFNKIKNTFRSFSFQMLTEN